MYGAFIRQVRASRGLTQVELARIVGIEQPNLSAYENDRQMPSADVLNRILVGCGYILEATAGKRRVVCPLPGSRCASTPDSRFGLEIRIRESKIENRRPNDELSALKLEQVLALADAVRMSKATAL
jgi:transcriptional regulator with XRE-family HTH domain